MEEYLIREGIALIAATTALIGAYFKGNLKLHGWMFSLVSSLFWITFAIMIQSPTVVAINFINIYLSVRGYFIWKRQIKNLSSN